MFVLRVVPAGGSVAGVLSSFFPAKPLRHRNPHGAMMPSSVHPAHSHEHGPHCDHPAVVHRQHIDHLHGGHLHHQGDDGAEEHVVQVDEKNPDRCTPRHDCGGTDHDERHVHSEACGHLLVPHGDHFDRWVRDHLHHPHGDHCDDHGPLERRHAWLYNLKSKEGDREIDARFAGGTMTGAHTSGR